MTARHDAAMAENARRIAQLDAHAGIKFEVTGGPRGRMPIPQPFLNTSPSTQPRHESSFLLTLHRAMCGLLTYHAPSQWLETFCGNEEDYEAPVCITCRDEDGDTFEWPCDVAEAALRCYETEAGE